MRIGIVGCGLNSDYHISFARDYSAEIVGLVDKDPEKAEKAAAKYSISKTYRTVQNLIDEERPDVVHIVTPPHTHFSLAKEAIQRKCNVLVEKPMAVNPQDAIELYNLAEKYDVRVCAMHNHFFDPCMVKANNLIQSGQVGKIVNVESYYGMNTRIDAFRKYPSPNVLPWVYTLPGGVFQDFMAHPLYLMLPFTGKPREIKVMEKSSDELPQGISDELRILIKGEKAFGVLTFSFAAKPHLHFVRVYGTKMMVNVDFNTMTTTTHPVSHLPKAAQKAVYNLDESWQLFSSTVANVWNFGRGRLRPYQGMKVLIHRFYDAIQGKGELPVAKEEALEVLETMDKIFRQVKNIHLGFDPIIPSQGDLERKGDRVLVTGATGFLGSRLVEMLLQKGFQVRALARKVSNIEQLKRLHAEVFFGDVANVESLLPAFEGIDYVIHAAADTAGTEDGQIGTIQGTKNVIDLCERFRAKKLIYISSCSVYGVAGYKTGQTVTEESPLERFPEKRGFYSHAKLKAEEIVHNAMKKGSVPIVCLRPGTIFGPGSEIYTPMMGFSLGRKIFAIIGRGNFLLPLVYIDNLIEAIVPLLESEKGNGRTYNIVDPDRLTKKKYAELLLKKLYPKSYCVYIPCWFLYTAVLLQEMLSKIVGRSPFLSRYRLTSSQREVLYDASKIKEELGWNPTVSMKEAIDRILLHERTIS